MLLAVYLGLALLYNAAVPLGEGPDEPGHAAYVFFLAREGRLPVQRAERAQSDVPGEGHQPPLAYLLAAPAVLWLPRDERGVDLPGNPRFTWAGGPERNAVAHGSREYWPWRGEVLAWRLARLVSTLFGAVTVVCTYLACRALVVGEDGLKVVIRGSRGAGEQESRRQGDKETGRPGDRERRRTGASYALQLPIRNPQSAIQNPRSKIALLAAALVAFNPQFLFTSALISNDGLLTALFAVAVWLIVDDRRPTTDDRPPTTDHRPLWATTDADHESMEGTAQSKIQKPKSKIRTSRVIALGLVVGLALITKQSALLLLPVALLALVDLRQWHKPQGLSWPRYVLTWSPGHRAVLMHWAILLALITGIAGWWYLRNWQLYGDPLGLRAFQAEFVTQPFAAGDLWAWVSALSQLYASFWARFGWMNVAPPAWVTWFYVIIGLVGVAGLALRSPVAGHWVLLVLPVLAGAWVLSFALTAGLVAWQGRLLFPALPAIAILLALGMQNVLRSGVPGQLSGNAPRVETTDDGRPMTESGFHDGRPLVQLVLFYLLLCVLFVLALWLPPGVIRPAYPFQTLPEAEARAQLAVMQSAYGKFGRPDDPGAEVLGWRVVDQLHPGGTLDLDLIWHALGRQNRDWTVFVHLVDAQDNIVAETNAQPRGGAFPMTQWVTGDWVADRQSIRLPETPAAGIYTLRIGLYDPEWGGRRAALYDRRGKLAGDYLELGPVRMTG
jgi:4-amino-4-deoxy-L-arabinose transferase-like glycosyltransferase